MISSAVGSERVSKVVGYKIGKGFYKTSSDNLPQRIAVLGQCNTANESGLDETPYEVTSADQAAKRYGYGSMIHLIMRILRPKNSDGVGGIPTVIYPQKAAAGATATVVTGTVTLSSTATDSATHYLVINGRDSIDGVKYAYSVIKGDTSSEILVKQKDAVNNVPNAPCIATNGGGAGTETSLILTSKWEGLSSAGLQLRVDTGEKDCGITYANTTVAGTGAADISDALDLFGNVWNTIVINPYGEEVNDDLEAFNGIPDPDVPTGRYAAINFKPFIAIWGSVEETAVTLGAITDARIAEVTCALAPAPASEGFAFEAAANMAYLFAKIAQDYPHQDVSGKYYPDMPVPANENIGEMGDYENRDYLVKKGASTVDLSAGKYIVQDFITSYHPVGEDPPAYRYPRNLNLDFNVRYGYYLLELIHVVGKTIANDDQQVLVDNTIKPKGWNQVLRSYADDLSQRALSADSEFMKVSIETGISSTNPDRFETRFKYKRTGVARISSTDAEAGFNYGNV